MLPRLNSLITLEQWNSAYTSSMFANDYPLVANLWNSLYYYFAEVIPYSFNITNFESYFINNLTAILNLYYNNLLMWNLRQTQLKLMISQLTKNQTFNRTEDETRQLQQQTNQVQQESFNPLNNQSTINPISLQPASLGSLQPNDLSFTNANNTADFNTSSNAVNNNASIVRTYTELDLAKYKDIELESNNLLNGFIRKIASLFFVLSDSKPLGTDLGGFNIW